MNLADIGESGLIGLLRRGAPAGADVRVGIGDDTAVVAAPSGRELLLTCDLLAEGVHFCRDWYADSPELLGRRALAVNLSDVAGMGGRPLHCLVTLGVPRDVDADFLRRVYDGLYGLAAECGVSVVGGDTVGFDGGMLLDVFLVGEVPSGRALLRSGARTGDAIVVTGDFGLARAGLHLLAEGDRARPPGAAAELSAAIAAAARGRLLSPPVRLDESAALAATGSVHALSDTSDGLAAQIALICEASRLGAIVEAGSIPVSRETRAIASRAGVDPAQWALYGGEDYELIAAVAPGQVAALLEAMPEGAVPLSVIGRFTAAPEILVAGPEGRREPLGKAEYRHF